MARPIKRGTSANWLLKARVPSEIVSKVCGHVVLPIGGGRTLVAISAGSVEVSLRTSDPDEAALRHAHPTVFDQANRLDLELMPKFPSLHTPPPAS